MYPASTSWSIQLQVIRPTELHISYAYLNIPQSNGEVTVDVLVTDCNQAKAQKINNNQTM